MKHSSFVLFLVISQMSYAGSENEQFSIFASALTIDWINEERHITYSSGEIEISGDLVFTLDMGSETGFVDVLFVNFVPDEQSTKLLPQVVGGFYPGKITKIRLFNGPSLVRDVLGENPKEFARESKERYVSVSGKLRIEKYTTAVECDARQYIATPIEFIPAFPLALTEQTERKDVNGC